MHPPGLLAGVEPRKRNPGEILRSTDMADADGLEPAGKFREPRAMGFECRGAAARRAVGLGYDEGRVSQQDDVAFAVLPGDFEGVNGCEPLRIAVRAVTVVVLVIWYALMLSLIHI